MHSRREYASVQIGLQAFWDKKIIIILQGKKKHCINSWEIVIKVGFIYSYYCFHDFAIMFIDMFE